MNRCAPCRLLLHEPAPGDWNMAVDEVLLDEAAGRPEGCWRFYGWSEPTLSLGYFQDYAQRVEHASSRRCPAVRRLTGGGTLLHDAELTYSVVLPGGHRLAAQRDLLYQAVHGCLIEALAELSISAVLCQGQAQCPAESEPFLCFQRRAPGDVLLGSAKIAGSAQRRRHGAVLQHGSLLLRQSPAAPELPGLEDLTGKSIPVSIIGKLWLDKLARRLDVVWSGEPLTEQESQRVTLLAKTRYGWDPWTQQRDRGGPPLKNVFDLADCN